MTDDKATQNEATLDEVTDRESLTVQEQMVMAHLNRTYANSIQTGDHLDNKATALMQAGGLVIALTGVVKIPGFASNPTAWAAVGISLAFLAFAGMILAAVKAWNPSNFSHAGAIEWDEMFNAYLLKDVQDCYSQELYDLSSAIEDMFARNISKGKYVRLSALLFAIQIVGVLILALVG